MSIAEMLYRQAGHYRKWRRHLADDGRAWIYEYIMAVESHNPNPGMWLASAQSAAYRLRQKIKRQRLRVSVHHDTDRKRIIIKVIVLTQPAKN